MKHKWEIQNSIQLLAEDGHLPTFGEVTPELTYRCLCCDGQFTDARYAETGDGYACIICSNAEWKAEQNIAEPSSGAFALANDFAQLNAEDFQFFICRQGKKPWGLKSAYPQPQEMEFCDLRSEFNNPTVPEEIFQQISIETVENYRNCFFKAMYLDLPSTESLTDDSPEYRAIVAFKRLVALTKPETIPYSYVKKLGARRRWCWIIAATKEALPEETLLRNFFYFYCSEYGADYRSAIRLYRRLEPLETIMKISSSEDRWLDERDKNLRFLIKNSASKPAAADIASGVG
jgi:hypothetical protein